MNEPDRALTVLCYAFAGLVALMGVAFVASLFVGQTPMTTEVNDNCP